jgi:hypothetical protein
MDTKPVVVEPTHDELLQRITELEKAVANKNAKGTSMRVSEKGALSFYGVGRFPVTLYASQWRTIIASIPQLQQFLADNAAVLSEKPAKSETASA